MNNANQQRQKGRLEVIKSIVGWTLFLLCLLTLLKLAFWQLSRAESKEILLEQRMTRENNPAVSLTRLLSSNDIQFAPLLLKGKWLKDWQFNLDNRIKNGITGYNLYSIFADQSGINIFVDRGWIALDAQRNFEFIAPRQNQTQVLGYAFQADVYDVVETPNLKKETIVVMPGLNLPQIHNFLEQRQVNLAPFILRQTFPETEDGLLRKWVIMTFPPERHIGYAVQWFGLAFILVLFPIISWYKKP